MRENRKSQYNAIHVYKEKVEKPTSKTAENFSLLFYHIFYFFQENKPPFANKALRYHNHTQIMVSTPLSKIGCSLPPTVHGLNNTRSPYQKAKH